MPGMPTPPGTIGTPPGPKAATGMFGSPAAAACWPGTIILPGAYMLLKGTPGGNPPIMPIPGGMPCMPARAALY